MFVQLLIVSGLVLLALLTILWLISLIVHNASIVDIFWGIGFITVAWVAYALTQGYLPRKQLVAALVTLWGLRLALHIGLRNWGKPEDLRYAKWREEHGARWWWLSFFQVFLLQGFLIWIISMPLLGTQTSGFPVILTPLDWLGAALWTFGLIFESVADAQLTRFRTQETNQGKLLTSGLWRWSRHPNYFGEAMVWWGVYVIALAAGYGWTIFSPILITYLLVKVSGVAMLESTLKSRPGYEEYMHKTSAFFPWWPK